MLCCCRGGGGSIWRGTTWRTQLREYDVTADTLLNTLRVLGLSGQGRFTNVTSGETHCRCSWRQRRSISPKHLYLPVRLPFSWHRTPAHKGTLRSHLMCQVEQNSCRMQASQRTYQCATFEASKRLILRTRRLCRFAQYWLREEIIYSPAEIPPYVCSCTTTYY
jgi:hypothetical protein